MRSIHGIYCNYKSASRECKALFGIRAAQRATAFHKRPRRSDQATTSASVIRMEALSAWPIGSDPGGGRGLLKMALRLMSAYRLKIEDIAEINKEDRIARRNVEIESWQKW